MQLPLLAKRADLFELTAFCDLSRATLDTLAHRYGVRRRHESLEALLGESGLDAVLILTSGSHGEAALAAAEAGLAVLCEKPLAYTLAEADALAALEPRLSLGYMKLYDPAVVRAGSLVAGRPPVRSVEVTVLHPTPAAQLAHAALLRPAGGTSPDTRELEERALGAAPEQLRRLYADVLLGSLVHELAVVRALAGDPVRIDHVDVWPDGVWPPSVAVEGVLASGARLSIRWHHLARYPAYREEVRLHDDEGTIALVFPSPYLLYAPTELTVVGGEAPTVFRSTVEAFEQQLVAFHRLVVAGEPPAAGIGEGRVDIVTCQRIARRLAELWGLELGGEAATA